MGCWRERWWERRAGVSVDGVVGGAGAETAGGAAGEAAGGGGGDSGGGAVRNHFRRRISHGLLTTLNFTVF